jgi:hypothetical protein
MDKPLINLNVPKVGRITTQDVLRFAFLAFGIVAVWNWSERIPGIGPTVTTCKSYIRKAIGARVV